MVERTQQRALAIHGQVTRGPQGWRADIDGEDRVRIGVGVDQARQVLRMDRLAMGRRRGQFVEFFAGLGIEVQCLVEKFAIGVGFDSGQ